MQFIFIPPGALTMGSTDAEIAEAVAAFTPTDDQNWPDFFRSEGPQHTVRLTQPVYMGIHEVTQAEYEQVLGKDRNRSCFAPLSSGKNDVAGVEPTRHPVEMVSWNDAAEFCAKLSWKEQLKPFYLREGETVTPLEGTGYRLPSEAQWEFACRGGTTTRFSTGDRIADLDAMGWFSLNSQGRTHAVGEKSANPFGLYDMHGNVEEWCQDHYSAYPEQLVENPSVTSTTETRRVIRGGFWTSISPLCRSSHRFARTPESQFNYTGFRVTLDVAAVKEAMAR
jgi:formylglycine-generating enzyme required for sulfatase activity